MAREQSLRELRRELPGNVAILPTAAPRQVKQAYSKAWREKRDTLLETQVHAFPFCWHGERDKKRTEADQAEVFAAVRGAPEMLIALSVFAALDETSRLRALLMAGMYELAGIDGARDAVRLMQHVSNSGIARKDLVASPDRA